MHYSTHLRRFERGLALLGAVGITAAAGLGALDQTAGTSLRLLPADAHAQHAPKASLPLPSTDVLQGRDELDPAPRHLGGGVNQHG
jgi:hypothetical protein